MNAKVEAFEEEKKFGGLTRGEIAEAEKLMVESGELQNPNDRQMA